MKDRSLKKSALAFFCLLFGLMALCSIAGCSEYMDDEKKNPRQPLSIVVTQEDSQDSTMTRIAFSGVSSSFEDGDKIGIFVVSGTTHFADNVCYTYNSSTGVWSSTSPLEYDEDLTFYAYYPYIDAPYSVSYGGAATADAVFAAFIADASDKFHYADQSTKANFDASNLMVAKGTHTSGTTIAFTMARKKGLAVFNGTEAATATFSGANRPYSNGDVLYYNLKPATATAFTDDETGTSYTLYAESGKFISKIIGEDPYAVPLTFVAVTSGTFSFSKAGLSYSLNNGETWTALAANANTPTVTAGNKIMWKNNTTLTPNDEDGIGTFSSTGTFDAEGNIMSLFYGNNPDGHTSLEGKDYAFHYLFNSSLIRNANSLLLPSTTLSAACYDCMFNECTSLITAPALPATNLARACYLGMFYECSSLTTAPALPATTLTTICYYQMFEGCTSLTTAPALPATTLTRECYKYMFDGCTSLTTAPALPATTLAESCYESMFSGCTALTTAPTLPATTLDTYCYESMFEGCTALTTAPSLPATTLAAFCYFFMFYECTALTTAPTILPATTLTRSCYESMFEGCTALTTAPELPATELVHGCYWAMFSECSSLNTVRAAFVDNEEYYDEEDWYDDVHDTEDWLSGVAVSGTFYKNSAATWNVTGSSGVPSGWTVITYTP